MGFAGHPIARPRYQFPKSAIQYGARLAHLNVEMLARASHRDLIFRDLARSLSGRFVPRVCENYFGARVAVHFGTRGFDPVRIRD